MFKQLLLDYLFGVFGAVFIFDLCATKLICVKACDAFIYPLLAMHACDIFFERCAPFGWHIRAANGFVHTML